MTDRYELFMYAGNSIRSAYNSISTEAQPERRPAWYVLNAASIAAIAAASGGKGDPFLHDRRGAPHKLTATPAPAPRRERRAEYPLESLLRRLYIYRRTMNILLQRVEDAGGPGTREGCKLAVLLNRTYLDASDCYWRLRRQLDSIPLPF